MLYRLVVTPSSDDLYGRKSITLQRLLVSLYRRHHYKAIINKNTIIMNEIAVKSHTLIHTLYNLGLTPFLFEIFPRIFLFYKILCVCYKQQNHTYISEIDQEHK